MDTWRSLIVPGLMGSVCRRRLRHDNDHDRGVDKENHHVGIGRLIVPRSLALSSFSPNNAITHKQPQIAPK
jgi:hypothetical protein